MTTVFVYEYFTALGLGRDESDPAHSLYREGQAMRDAVVEDFARMPGVTVRTLELDTTSRKRLHLREEEAFCKSASEADWSLIIAPELGSALATYCRWVTKSGGRLLGPSVEAVETTSNKIDLSRVWKRAGVPTPRTEPFLDWFRDEPRFPVICKPIDGAGSTATARFERLDEVIAIHAAGQFEECDETSLLLQDYVPGQSASVTFLIGPSCTIALPPAFQILSSDGRFKYEGGALPIPADLAERADKLGRQAIECVPGLLGYVGVDLILGDDADRSQDYAIEINPRLTTSYVGLRKLANFNLAEAMLHISSGRPVGDLRWKPGRTRFHPDGKTEHDPTPGIWFG